MRLKIAGLGFVSLVIAVLGLVVALVGVTLGVLDGDTLGGMVGMVVGIGMIVVAFMFKDEV
jgi:hypothetical protein